MKNKFYLTILVFFVAIAAAYSAIGTVNTSGTAVTWVSGDKFVTGGAWNNVVITIGTSHFTIASVTNSTHLTLKTSAGNMVGVPYSVTTNSVDDISETSS